MTDEEPKGREDREPPIEEVEREVEDRNPDPTTKREAFEREAAERGRAEDAGRVGDEMDGHESEVSPLPDVIVADHSEIEQRLDAVVTAPTSRERSDAFRDLVRRLVAHESAEKEVVRPLIRELEDGDNVAESHLTAEDDLEQRLGALERLDPDAPEFERRLGALRAIVVDHFRSEERNEHAMLRERLDEDEQRAGARDLRSVEDRSPTHPHPGAPESAAGNATFRPVLALVDRLLDRVRSLWGSASAKGTERR